MFHKVSINDEVVVFDLKGKLDYLTQQRISYIDGVAEIKTYNPYQFHIIVARLYDIMEVVTNVRAILSPEGEIKLCEKSPIEENFYTPS